MANNRIFLNKKLSLYLITFSSCLCYLAAQQQQQIMLLLLCNPIQPAWSIINMKMEKENGDFASRAAKASFALYDSIGKKGKPQAGREWTLLATFLKTDTNG